MVNHLIPSIILLLAISSPALALSGSQSSSPSFTSFLTSEASHESVSPQQLFAHQLAKITPNKRISIQAYLEGYKLVDGKVKATLPAQFNRIVSELKQIKTTIKLLHSADLRVKADATGTLPAFKAKKAAQEKAQADDKTKTHTAEERQAIADEMQRMIKLVKTAKLAGQPIPKVAGEDDGQIDKASFNKLDRNTQLKLIAQRRFRRNTEGFTNALAVLGWRTLDQKTRKALIAQYPAQKKKSSHNQKTPAAQQDQKSKNNKETKHTKPTKSSVKPRPSN